jgi:hypothetical protein
MPCTLKKAPETGGGEGGGTGPGGKVPGKTAGETDGKTAGKTDGKKADETAVMACGTSDKDAVWVRRENDT